MSDLITLDQVTALASRIEGPMRQVREAQEKEARESSPAFSALVHFDNNETKQTQLIAGLLRPDGAHGQGTLFLKLFLREAWKEVWEGKSEEDFRKMKVRTEVPTRTPLGTLTPRRIDLLIDVEGKEVRLAVESKARGAADQADQIKDYLAYLGPRSKLIYLSRYGEKPGEISIARVTWEEECTHRRVEAGLYSAFIGKWLKECKDKCSSERVKYFIEDLMAFTEFSMERLIMTPTTIEPLRPLLKEPLDDQQEILARDTLLTVALLGNHIVAAIYDTFQKKLRAALEHRGLICTGAKPVELTNYGDLTKEVWGSLNARCSGHFGDAVDHPFVRVERCPSGWHGRQPSPHLVLGLWRSDLRGEAALRWRQIATTMLGEGTGDNQWIWQKIIEGFETLDSKDALVKLLDPETITDIAEEMGKLSRAYDEIAKRVAG